MQSYNADLLWEAMQQRVSPPLAGRMQCGRPLTLDEHKLVVGFIKQYEFALEHLLEPSNRAILMDTAQTLLGRPFCVALELESNKLENNCAVEEKLPKPSVVFSHLSSLPNTPTLSVLGKSPASPEAEGVQGLRHHAEWPQVADIVIEPIGRSHDNRSQNDIPEIHRTWIDLLVVKGYTELAALVLDAELEKTYDEGKSVWAGFMVSLPPESYEIVMSSTNFQEDIKKSLAYLTRGYIVRDEICVTIRIKFIAVEENWKEKVKNLIINAKESNQGLVTEKVFSRRGQQPLLYNEMKFASRSEIRIAQELEEKRVLFFPLPLAVRSETGALFEDHREVDFLICENGTWGILEVAYHPNRYEKDSEKDIWFKKSGILCIQNYTAERCFNYPSEVVDEFLLILAQHKR